MDSFLNNGLSKLKPIKVSSKTGNQKQWSFAILAVNRHTFIHGEAYSFSHIIYKVYYL